MEIKDMVSQYRELFLSTRALEDKLEANNKALTELENKIKHTMVEQGLTSFEAAGFGAFTVLDKVTFEVKAANKDAMMQWFEQDAELKNLVKTKKDVNFQSAQKVFRDMYNESNTVPPFVEVKAFQLLDFKPEKGGG